MSNPERQHMRPNPHFEYGGGAGMYQPFQQDQHQQESLAQIEPMLVDDNTSSDMSTRTKFRHHTQLADNSSAGLKVKSLMVRLLLFTVIWVIAAAAQLIGLSAIINNVTGESDLLKQRVAYWATACTILYGSCLFFLARWFTTDLVWHWHTSYLKQLWGLQPSITSFSIGLVHIRMPLMILFTLCLSLMSIASMVANFWLTSSTHIAEFTTSGSTQFYTLLDIPSSEEYNDFSHTGGVVFESFVVQSGANAAGVVKLTPFDNKYFWSPFLDASTSMTINVKDVAAISVAPKCTLLSARDLGVPYNQTSKELNFTIADHQFTIDTPRKRRYYWNVEANQFIQGHDHYWNVEADKWLPVSNNTDAVFAGVSVYNVMARRVADFGEPSFFFYEDLDSPPSYVYATNCTVEVDWWNVTGTISSIMPQRLNITNAVRARTHDKFDTLQLFAAIYREGLGGFTKSEAGIHDSESYNLKSPLWMWMMGQYYDVIEDEEGTVSPLSISHPNISNAAWVELKLSEIVGGTMTRNTVAIMPRQYLGSEVIQSSIITTHTIKIIAGVVVQSALLWIPILIYIAKRKASVFYGDDIALLLNKDSERI
ncbi:hypothetical protein BGX27_008416 [Mortierella sp. AM989]|nr:hypothetical protein BGX27_008416 [Mortierella sp. AM989]